MNDLRLYMPEGWSNSPFCTAEELKAAVGTNQILEGFVTRSDIRRVLHVSVNGYHGIIDAEEVAAARAAGANKEAARLSLIGKPVCFCVIDAQTDEKGQLRLILSRKRAQEQALNHLFEEVGPGTVLPAKVTHLEPYGGFVDIGCGIISLLPTEKLSVSRVAKAGDRLHPGQRLRVVVTDVDTDSGRFYLSHRELLGTWMENAALFKEGEAVPGIVRACKDYGVFVELTPNLVGLADYKGDIAEGAGVSVLIKSIHAETMKIKLQIISRLESTPPMPFTYQITDGTLSRWIYSPPESRKQPLITEFISSDS